MILKPVKPKLIYRYGHWQISNWTECLQTTTLNSKERWFVHQALAWIRIMGVKHVS